MKNKKIIINAVAFVLAWMATPLLLACRDGFEPSDTPGICQEKATTTDQRKWVLDEKPPADKMPSYQREGIHVVDAPSTAAEDAKQDKEKSDAMVLGKKAAGL